MLLLQAGDFVHIEKDGNVFPHKQYNFPSIDSNISAFGHSPL